MHKPRHKPLYLERETYRRRRLMDGARVLPVVGLGLVLLPALWPERDLPATHSEVIYLFCIWAVLIVVARLLARPLLRASKDLMRQGPSTTSLASGGMTTGGRAAGTADTATGADTAKGP